MKFGRSKDIWFSTLRENHTLSLNNTNGVDGHDKDSY